MIIDNLSQYAWNAVGWFDAAHLMNAESVAAGSLFVVLGVFMILEWKFPFARLTTKAAIRGYFHNASIFLFNNVTLSLLAITSLYVVAERIAMGGSLENQHLSLIDWFLWLIIIDFSMYIWHVANHKIPWLWMFHKVHHSDTSVNASTALRFHVGELVLTVVYKCAVIIVLGLSEPIIIATQALLTGFSLFHHSNIAFKAEKWLARIIVVPALHRMHHSTKRSEHDANYGSILSIWDRLFGTLKGGAPADIGLRGVNEHSVWESFLFGLTRHYPTATAETNNIPEYGNSLNERALPMNPMLPGKTLSSTAYPWYPNSLSELYLSYWHLNLAMTKNALELFRCSVESFNARALETNRLC